MDKKFLFAGAGLILALAGQGCTTGGQPASQSNQPQAAAVPSTNTPTEPTTNAPAVNTPTTNAPAVNIPIANAPIANAPTANAPTANAPVVNTPTPTQPKPTAVATKTFDVKASNFAFDVKEMKVKVGDKVKVTFTNVEGFHDWVIDEFGARTQKLGAGASETVEFTASKKGTFEYYCSIGKHRAMGMVGKLIIE